MKEQISKQYEYLGSRKITRRCDVEKALPDGSFERVASAGIGDDLDVVLVGAMGEEEEKKQYRFKLLKHKVLAELDAKVKALEARVKKLEEAAE